MVALLEDAGGGGTSVVLGRHGGGNATVMGAFASSPSTALVTVQGDGVIMYDCEAQTRARSWAVGRGHTFAAPAVYDAGCGQYFAALSPAGGAGDPALVTWTETDPTASLDGTVGGGSTRLPDGLAALVPVGDGGRGGATGGGVLAVDGAGAVRWFGADTRKLAASAPPGAAAGSRTTTESAGTKKHEQQRHKRIVEAASAVDGGGGVLVVTVESARGVGARTGGAGGVGRTATLYRAVGGEHSGRSVETAWEVDIGVPDEEVGAAPRVVAAAASDDELVVLWSGGVWAAYAPRGGKPGAPTRSLALAGGESAPAAPTTTGGKKRSARASAADAHADASQAGAGWTLPAAACVPLGGGYYAVAQVGGRGGGGARVAVIDTRYGAVHASLETHPGASGSEQGVHVAALSDNGGSYRMVIVLAGEVVLSEVPAPPPLSLAAALGALSTGGVGPAGTGVAAGRVLGSRGVAACSKPPQHGVVEPRLPLSSESMSAAAAAVGEGGCGGGGGSMVDLGDPTNVEWWDGSGGAGGAEKAARDAVTLFEGDAPIKAAAAANALKPFLSGGSTLPPAVLTATVEGCVRRNQWEPVQTLLAGGHVPSSAAAPGLVAALIAGDRLMDLEAFLASAREVSAADLRRCLDAFLGEESKGRPSAAATGAAAARLRAAAEAAVRDAESAAAAAGANRETTAKKKQHGGGAAAAAAARSALHRARIAAAAVEDFSSMTWAAPLHALVARPLDPATAAEALPGLPAAAAAKLIAHLSVWLTVYSGGGGGGGGGGGTASVDLSARPPRCLPSVGAVVSWASAVIDAHFTTFAMGVGAASDGSGRGGGSDRAAMASLRAAAAKLQAACASVGKVGGALRHMREGAPLPEHNGTRSTTYTIELVDW